jgi:hypothetical protein
MLWYLLHQITKQSKMVGYYNLELSLYAGIYSIIKSALPDGNESTGQ